MSQVDYKKQYTEHFKNIGRDAEDTAKLIADYERNTKGYDQAQAFEALEGGRQFDPKGGDGRRYEAISRAKAAKGATGQKTNPIDNTQTAANDAVPSNTQINDTNIKNVQRQNVNQDNDIINTISGDGNSVTNNQDNSISQRTINNSDNSRYYDDSNRYFSYGNVRGPVAKVGSGDFLRSFLADRFGG